MTEHTFTIEHGLRPDDGTMAQRYVCTCGHVGDWHPFPWGPTVVAIAFPYGFTHLREEHAVAVTDGAG